MGSVGLTVLSLGDAKAVFCDARACPVAFSPEDLPSLLTSALGFPVAVLIPRQRHTNLLFTFSGRPPERGKLHVLGVCDGLITPERGVALAVQTADCLPIVFGNGALVCVVHAGWRGLSAGIVEKAVRLIQAQFSIPPTDLQVIVGVGVGPCHYPVGQEVTAALERQLGPLGEAASGTSVDLQACACKALRQAGVPPSQVQVLSGCTACSPHYHSYRRDGPRAGRQWAAAVLPPL